MTNSYLIAKNFFDELSEAIELHRHGHSEYDKCDLDRRVDEAGKLMYQTLVDMLEVLGEATKEEISMINGIFDRLEACYQLSNNEEEEEYGNLSYAYGEYRHMLNTLGADGLNILYT